MIKRILITILLVLCLAGATYPALAAPAPAGVVTPGLCRVKTDMELPYANGLPVNYRSRTLLASFTHIPGGITPATIRLQGGVGSLQLSPAWMGYISLINQGSATKLNYLFHANSGWQNSTQRGTVEELAFENQWMNVLRVSGQRAYVQTYFVNEQPPATIIPNDPRRQLFTIVTADNHIIGSPKGNAYIVLIARRGEVLWIPTYYLDCPSRFPVTVTVRTGGSTLNIRATPSLTGLRFGSYPDGSSIVILGEQTDGAGNQWGGTSLGWVALWLTSWQVP